jgi:hypothetical protein
MESVAEQFVHALLFACSQCRRPIALAIASFNRNVDDIDGRCYRLQCSCSWAGEFLGIEAKKHWVESWAE